MVCQIAHPPLPLSTLHALNLCSMYIISRFILFTLHRKQKTGVSSPKLPPIFVCNIRYIINGTFSGMVDLVFLKAFFEYKTHGSEKVLDYENTM